jgi:hypothetical protein
MCWRYAYVILKFLVAGFSGRKADILTSAIGQAAHESLTIGDGEDSIQIPTREKSKHLPRAN